MVQSGTVLQERFEIVREIGRGGMGAVYESRDLKFNGSRVAIKQCLLTGEPMKRAFFREASLLAGLEHPYLPDVREHFVEGDGHFLVMKFIEGEDLETLLLKRGEPFGVAEVKAWMDQLLDALAYIHNLETPVIHRDIKPGNIKLTVTKHIKLLDFGLAKGGGTSSVSGYSLNFAAPEQLQETGSDARSDLYSLGATMYRLLTGQMPKSAFERSNALVNDLPDPLVAVHKLNPLVPESVSQVITEAMALKQKERIPTAEEMKRRLSATMETKAPIEAGYSSTQVNNTGYSRTEVKEEQKSQTAGYQPTDVKNEPKPTGVSKSLTNDGEARRADLRVDTVVPIWTPVPKPVKPPEPAPLPQQINGTTGRKSKLWIGVAAGGLIILIGAWLFLSSKKEEIIVSPPAGTTPHLQEVPNPGPTVMAMPKGQTNKKSRTGTATAPPKQATPDPAQIEREKAKKIIEDTLKADKILKESGKPRQ